MSQFQGFDCYIKSNLCENSYARVIFAHLTEYAINILLVHRASDGVFAQARSNGAEVVQRRHPESHFCLLVTELVHLERKVEERTKKNTHTLTLDRFVFRDDTCEKE